MIIVYIALITSVFVLSTCLDAWSTALAISSGAKELNPIMVNNTQKRLVRPFFFAIPLVVVVSGIEYVNFDGSSGQGMEHGLMLLSDVNFVQIASLLVFVSLAMSCHKFVASASNLMFVKIGVALPDLILFIFPNMRGFVLYLATVVLSLIAVLPMIFCFRSGLNAILKV